MKKSKLREIIKSIISEMMQNEEDIEEATTTGAVDGYMTPFAFSGGGEDDKKKRKEYSTSSTGYKIVKELVKEILGEI